MTQNAEIYLHIGCGITVSDQWLNMDTSPTLRLSKIPIVGSMIGSLLKAPKWPQSVQCGNIVKGLSLPRGSCSLIFASHVLEHLGLQDFHKALEHLHFYLRPNGILRIIVPDLECYLKIYDEQLRDKKLVPQAACQFMINSHLGCSGSRSGIFRRLREALANSRHQWLWDFYSLSDALVQHGFAKIRRSRFGDGSHPLFKLVEEEHRFKNAICLEATKL